MQKAQIIVIASIVALIALLALIGWATPNPNADLYRNSPSGSATIAEPPAPVETAPARIWPVEPGTHPK